jgi:hypothetical protein
LLGHLGAMQAKFHSLIRSTTEQLLRFAANRTLVKREPAIYAWRCRVQDWVS